MLLFGVGRGFTTVEDVQVVAILGRIHHLGVLSVGIGAANSRFAYDVS